MGTVIVLGWKMYDWAVEAGDRQSALNNLARITVVVLMGMAVVYCVLVAVGSEPSVV